MGYIYILTNKINGKKYVGQTLRNDINIRWKEHMNNKNNNTCISKAFNKYNIKNFKFQIICICFDEDCNKYEIDYIKKYNTISPNGYNLESGGNNSKCHPDTIKLISQKMKEKWTIIKHPSVGIIHTEEYKKKMSIVVKKALKEKRLQGGCQNINSLENLKKATEKRKRVICQYTINNELIKQFNSISEAEIQTNINNRRISEVCNGKKKTAGGFIWKFI